MRPSFPLLLVLALALLTGVGIRHAGAQDPVRTRLDQLRSRDVERRADLLLARGKVVEGAALLEQAADLRPYQELRVRAAWLYLDAGDYDRAEKAVRALPEGRQNDLRLRSLLGAARLLQGQEQVDWSDYRARIRETPRQAEPRMVEGKSPEGKVAAAHILFREGLAPESARVLLERVVREKPDLAEAHLLLADLHQSQRREEEAFRARETYARLDPEGPRAAVARVWRLRAQAKWEEAAAALREVLARNPGSGSVFRELVQIYARMDAREAGDAALRDILLASFRSPSSAVIGQLQTVVDYFSESGRWEALVSLLQALLAGRPDDPLISGMLARVRVVQGRPEEALKIIQSLTPEQQGVADLRQLGFMAALAAGDLGAARNLLAANADRTEISLGGWIAPDANARSPVPPYARYLPYRVAPYHLERRPNASVPARLQLLSLLAAEEQMQKRFPDVPQVLLLRARTLRDTGYIARAVELMERAAELKPAWVEPRLFLAEYYYHRKETEAYARHRHVLEDKGLPPGTLPPPPPGARYVDRSTAEINMPPATRALRAAQALLLAGELEKGIAALKAVPLTNEPFLGAAVKRSLAGAYLAQGKIEAAEAQWAEVGFKPPFPIQPSPSPSFVQPFLPPAFPLPKPELDGDGTRLSHYPLAYVAVAAAQDSRRDFGGPDGLQRHWEHLLRLALKYDPDYLPAVYMLGHLLKNPRYNSGAGPGADFDARTREADALLARVLKERPSDLPTLTALGRTEEAARRNPSSTQAWSQLTTMPGATPELRLEARRNLRRLAPDALHNRYLLAMELAANHPEEAMREAEALANEPPGRNQDHSWGSSGDMIPRGPDSFTRAGRALMGVLYWRRGEWSRAAEAWETVTDTALGARQKFGSHSLVELSGLGRLALGERGRARDHFRHAARINSVAPLPRLFLAYLDERDFERDYELAAASSRVPSGATGEPELSLELRPVLDAILARTPDCFPATYLVTRQRLGATPPPDADYNTYRAEQRSRMQELAARFPRWSGPTQALSTAFPTEEPLRLEALLRREVELEVLLQARRAARTPLPETLPPPGPVTRAAELAWDYLDPGVFRTGDLTVWLGTRMDVLDERSGALLHSVDLMRSGRPALAGRWVVTPVEGGFAALDPIGGGLAWTLDWKHSVRNTPVYQGGRVAAVAEDGAAVCMDAHTGKLLWETPPTGKAVLQPIIGDDLLMVVDEQARARALRMDDGRDAWQGEIPAVGPRELRMERVQGVLAFPGRLIVAGNGSGSYLTAAVDTGTGKPVWSTTHDGFNAATRLRAGDRLLVANDYWPSYELINPKDGARLFATPDPSQPPPGPSGKIAGVFGPWLVYQNHDQRQWRAIDLRTHQPAWTLSAERFGVELTYADGQWITRDATHLEWRDGREP